MNFSLYSEIQHWPGKSVGQLYEEVVEQVVNADRLGFSAYSVIEHFFFPKFSVSANPFALWGICAARTKQIRFRTLGHVLLYHNPTILASQIAAADILFEAATSSARCAATAGSCSRPACSPRRATATRSRSRSSSPRRAGALLLRRRLLQDRRLARRPAPDRQVPRSSAARATAPTSSRPSAAGPWSPPLLPYAALQEQLDLYRAKCAEHGTTPDTSDPRVLHRRGRRHARREAERG